MSKRTFSLRSAFASWCQFSFKRLKPRSRQNRLRFERLEDRTLLTTFMPTTFDDGGLGSGSLRDAVLQANTDPLVDDYVILLKPGTYKLSIANTNGQENYGLEGDLDITTRQHNVIIQGGVGVPGSANAGPTIIDARGIDRAFHIFSTHTTVFFKDLTIQGGLAQDDGIDFTQPGTSDALGGAILSTDSTLNLDHVIIRYNEARGGNGADGVTGSPGDDGFAAQGGGIWTSGAVALTASSIRQNKAVGGNGGVGGAIGVNDADAIAHTGGKGGVVNGGGIFAFDTNVTVTTSHIARNSAIGGKGGKGGNGDVFDVGIGGDGGLAGDAFGGGLCAAGGTVTLTSSNISKNQDIGGAGGAGGIGKAGGNGGQAGFAFGGGIYANSNNALILTDTDLLGNVAQGGAGGKGHYGTETKPSGPDPDYSGLLGQGGKGGQGGRAWGGGLYADNTQGPISVLDGQVKDNQAKAGNGGYGGDGADESPVGLGGFAGTGGNGGVAKGGGLYLGVSEIPVIIDPTEVSGNTAHGGKGGNGGWGGYNEDVGLGGNGGEGGAGQGGGLFFFLFPNTPVNLTSSSILSNHAKGGGGGEGGTGGDDTSFPVPGLGGAGGTGGTAQGGGLFAGRNSAEGGIVTLDASQISKNDAIGGDGGHGANGFGSDGWIIPGGDGGAGGAGQGGGLFADGGTVSLVSSTMSTNTAKGGSGNDGGWGGWSMEGAAPPGAVGGGGGAGQGGGVFANSATLDITQSTIDNNNATGGQGGKGGEGHGTAGSTGGNGGNGGAGGAGQGGGLDSLGGTITVTNSTVSTNRAQGGNGGKGGKGGDNSDNANDGGKGGNGGNAGAGQGGGNYLSGESLTAHSATITANQVRKSTPGKPGKGGSGGNDGSAGSGKPGEGGGVFNLDATVNSFNTLIAGNTAGNNSTNGPDFFGLFNVALNNLLGIGDGSNLMPANPDALGNIVGSSTMQILPQLGPLANNGGPTKTHALLVGSPAINMGANLFSPGPTDQRGVGFDRIVGGTIDIGAFEFQGRPGTK
jgi:hypothetical protein